jgi:hypothetical protein
MKYQKKNSIVDAVQWFKLGDHPQVTLYTLVNDTTETICGWLNNIEGGHIINPGDWIIRKSDGNYYVCENEKFIKQYTLVV